MRKLIVLALKEVKLAFRDAGAILTMLATPLALTLAIGAAFGAGGDTPISEIPVLLLNQDTGEMSQYVLEAFYSDRVGDLVVPETVEDEATARARVEADEVAALVIIPADFSSRVMPLAGRLSDLDAAPSAFDFTQLTPEQQAEIASMFERSGADAEPAVVEIYASPDWRISTAIIKSIVSQVLEEMNVVSQGIPLIMSRLVFAGSAASQEWSALVTIGQNVGARLASSASMEEHFIHLAVTSTTGRGFNWLDYSAASMAILFLMFATTSGGRTLLAEREGGTLPRLLVTPTRASTILVGKMAGTVATGVLQVTILWIATSFIGAYWGEPLPVIVAIVGLVICATGVAALIAAWSKTPQQAGTIGSAFTLIGAALSGSFFPRMNLPVWVQEISLVTPNAWGIELFSVLQAGKGLAHILPLLGWMALLTAAYYAVAMVGFRRQFE